MAANATVRIDLELPAGLARLRLPEALDRRVQAPLDKQDQRHTLTPDEQAEAEGLVEIAELLTLLRLRVRPASSTPGVPSPAL